MRAQVIEVVVAKDGIEPPTQGFSGSPVADVVVVKSVTSEDARCVFCSTTHDFAQLIPAKLTRAKPRHHESGCVG
jgi:hypothetical protein